MPDFDPSLILRQPQPPADTPLSSLLGEQPKEPSFLTLEGLNEAIRSMREREERNSRAISSKYLAFVESLPEGIMESGVLTEKEIRELASIATVVAHSVVNPLNPKDAKTISERVGVIVAKHKRWSPS